LSFWQRIKHYWQQLDHQLRQAAIIYLVFAICVIMLQIFFNIGEIAGSGADVAEAFAVPGVSGVLGAPGAYGASRLYGEPGTPGVPGAENGEGLGVREHLGREKGLEAEGRTEAGATHKVDLTDLSLALDQEIVAKLGLDRRDPGVAIIPARHSWQIAVRRTGKVEWHWAESSHQYDLSETFDQKVSANQVNSLNQENSAAGRSIENLRASVQAVTDHWADGSGREVAGHINKENGMMILNLELKLKPAEEEGAPLLTMSKLQIRLRETPAAVAAMTAVIEGAAADGIAGDADGAGGAASTNVANPGSKTEDGAGVKSDIGNVPGAHDTSAGSGTSGAPASGVPDASGAWGTPGKIPIPGGSVGDQPGRSARPKICIILDDGGEAAPDVAEEFWKLGSKWPLALAVLPYAPYSREQAETAKNLGFVVMLHLPMEPIGTENPGAGAIFSELSDAEIRERVQEALAAVPQAIGVNNHMGSKATSDSRVMKLVLSEVKRNNLFFLDSVTIASSVGYQEALRMGVPTAKRHVFLDNVASVEAVLKQLEELVRVARNKGTAIGIGHINRIATAQALAIFLPRLEELGIDLVPLTEIIK